mgnify:CR=1 FL=1
MAIIYSIAPYHAKIADALSDEERNTMPQFDVRIRYLGFKSCQFKKGDNCPQGYWEMSDEEFTFFVLRFYDHECNFKIR